MIFFFSGTGNSEYVAKKLLNEGETLVSMAEAMKAEAFQYCVPEKETVGFVFPVYFYTVPTIVRDFIDKLDLQGAEYIYSAITCGGGIGQAGAVLKKHLKAKGLPLHYVRDVLMPDNSMLFYQIPGEKGAKERIEKADIICEEIRICVENRDKSEIGDSTAISSLMDLGYKACSGTKKFYAQDSCISCGLCEKNCPQGVIKLVDGKPNWEKEKCCKCSACINRCPVAAIQYGKSTVKRNRYVNKF